MAVARLEPRISAQAPAAAPSGFASLGVFLLLVFLFLAYSRVTDILIPGWSLPLVLSVLALGVTVLTGGLPRALGSGPGKALTGLTVWLIVATPFSFWRAGSVDFLLNGWLKSFFVFVIVAGLLRTQAQCRLAMTTIAAATVAIAIMTMTLGTISHEGRLVLETGVLSNPNDLAQLLLIGVPFLLLVIMSQGRFMVTRALAAVCLGAVMMATGATGSRGALAAFACLTVLMFLNFSWANKIKLIAVLALTVPLVVSSMTPDQRQRYLTIFGPEPLEDADQTLAQSAIGSRLQRIALLRQSVGLTLQNPLFGVGPGVYQAAAARQSGEEGELAVWRESHNAYTQVSSEAGIPALVFYLTALYLSFRYTRTIYKAARERQLLELTNIAYCLWLSLVSFAVTSLFSSVAYAIYFPTLAGLAVALRRAGESALAAAPAAKAR